MSIEKLIMIMLLLIFTLSLSDAFVRRSRRRRRRRRNCTTNCLWASWGAYSKCTAPCGGGLQTRTRGQAVKAQCGGRQCVGSPTETRSCNAHCCPVHCSWGAWLPYGSCSVTCGGGAQSRFRRIARPAQCHGRGCSGSPTSARTCNTDCCRVDCKWGGWSAFTSCPTTCGSGTQTRTRTIETHESCGGMPCSGEAKDFKVCNDQCCPVNCRWSEWTEYNECSASCGGGTQSRRRSIALKTSCGGTECLGSASETRNCNTHNCPIDCFWSDWIEWEECSSTCNGGIQLRERRVNVREQHGGMPCEGRRVESRECNTVCCPVDCSWNDWYKWGICSKTCGEGMQSRQREVLISSMCGGLDCSDESSQERVCSNDGCCPVDCEYSDWSEFDSCTKTCGTGQQKRRRAVVTEESCGGSCDGTKVERRNCNSQCCPVDCVVSEWASWTECSATCGPIGVRTRSRKANPPQCGGVRCPENLLETDSCNQQCINGGTFIESQCLCPKTWKGLCCEEDEDIDECKDGNHVCQGLFMTCKNTLGDYKCECEGNMEIYKGECIDRP